MTASVPPDHSGFAAALRRGSSFGDRFQIERVIGGGGMGNVYEAMDLYRREVVALKVLRFRRELIDDAGARFRRETQILTSLDHPNVVEIRDFGYASDGTPWLTMELLEGQTLREKLEETSPLPWSELCELLKAAAGALAQAHSRGVIHRDLKPEHVFLCRDGTIKLLDFGLSLSVSSKRLTKKGAIVGTPRYMAPEQIISASDADARADVYGLAVLTYEALSGESPFDAADHGQLLGAIAQGRSVPLRTRRPDLGNAACRVVHRAMSSNASDRFATPDAFVQALVAAVAPGPSRPVALLRAGLPWALAIVALAVVLFALSRL